MTSLPQPNPPQLAPPQPPLNPPPKVSDCMFYAAVDLSGAYFLF